MNAIEKLNKSKSIIEYFLEDLLYLEDLIDFLEDFIKT
jgi:hypothetical protein